MSKKNTTNQTNPAVSITHVISIPDNFMNAQQVEGLLDDIHSGTSMIVRKDHYYKMESDLADAISALKEEPCVWTRDEDGIYDTGCGNRWFFDTGDADENRCIFCPYCGKPLEDISIAGVK